MGDGEVFAVLGIVLLFVMPFVVFILTKHQQRMAEIVHRGKDTQASTDAMASEMRELRSVLMQQSILIDSLVQNQSALAKRLDDGDVRARLELGNR